MIYYAHSLEGDPRPEHWQELHIHLRNVAELATAFARDAQPMHITDNKGTRELRDAFCRTAWYAGLLHDLGKYREEFQQYLRKERSRSTETAHAVYGAAAIGHRLDDLAASFAIAGHHAGLHDLSALDTGTILTGKRIND